MKVYWTGFGNISGDFTVREYGEEQCAKGYAFGPYIRNSYFIHYVYSGRGFFEAEGKHYDLSPGQIFLICPGQITYYKADDAEPWLYRWISFDGGYCQTLLRSAGLSISSPIFTDFPDGAAGNALKKIVDGGQLPFCSLMSLFWEFAAALGRGECKTGSAGEYVRMVKAYIHSHYMESVTISSIASHIGIDRSYLCRLFKAAEGVSPKEYLISYRLNLAKSLFSETSYSVSEVARLVGYSDALDFSKIFKSRFGMPPSDWIKGNRRR